MSPEILQGRLTAIDGHPVPVEFHVAGHDRCLVIVHGFYNSKSAVLLQQLAREMEASFDIALLDLRGHGLSGGLFTWTTAEWMDLKVVLESVRRRYRQVAVMGFSFGGHIAIKTLARFSLADALVSVSAPISVRSVDYHFWEAGMWKDFVYTLLNAEGRQGKGVRPGFFVGPQENALRCVEQVAIPVLFIHGDRDWVVKPRHSRDLFGAARSKKKLVVIEDGPHAEYLMRDCRERFLLEVKGWLSETLGAR